MTTIDSFVKRLKRIGVEVELVGNYPWVYMTKVNGKVVDKKYRGNHGFTVFFRAIKVGDVDKITDIKTIFTMIRKMLGYYVSTEQVKRENIYK